MSAVSVVSDDDFRNELRTLAKEYREKVLSTTHDKKTKTWVRKDNFLQVKTKIWKVRGNVIKYYSGSS